MTYLEPKNTIDFDFFNGFFPSLEEEHSLPTPYIEKNNNSCNNLLNKDLHDIMIEITNSFSKEETKDTKKFIKKKKSINYKNKYEKINLLRKIKIISLDLILKFINKKIAEVYNNNLEEGINTKVLLKINPQQIKNMCADYNKKLLNKTLREIFSADISKKFIRYPPSHNRDIIEKLLNEEDKEKKETFVFLFNKTYKECIQHLRDDIKVKGLEGLEENYYNYINNQMIDLEENEEGIKYKNEFENMFKEFDKTFTNKKARKKFH